MSWQRGSMLTWHSFDQQAVALPLHAEQVLPLFDEALEGVRLPLPLPGQVLGQALAAPQLAERQPAAAAQLLDALALQPPRGILRQHRAGSGSRHQCAGGSRPVCVARCPAE